MDNLIHVSFPNHFAAKAEYPPTESEMKAEIRGEPVTRKKREQECVAGLYWYPRLKIWKDRSGKVQFNPETKTALSYSWWEFVKPIKGKLVFNSFRYSPTTSTHQWCARSFLEEQGIRIDLEIESPKGLQRLDTALDRHLYLINELEAQIAKPRSNKRKNEERKVAILFHKAKVAGIKKLMK